MSSQEYVDWSLYGGAESTTKDGRPRRTFSSTGIAPKAINVLRDDKSHDFLWAMSEEPHRSRRMQILKAHPEVTKLMGFEPLTKYVVLGVVLIQLATAFILRHNSPMSLSFIAAAYFVGGTANHNLFLAIHEITHNLAFKGIRPNKVLAVFANLPIGIPYAMGFKKYHLEHHKQLGEDGVDTDLPTRLEMLVLQSVAGKAFFVTFQILFYAIRPTLVRALKPSSWHYINIFAQLLFDWVILATMGKNAIIYLIMSSFFAGSLHPCAGHFIAEHYLWDASDQETYSYYGPLNVLTYNVGYHNEHHDFPSVPWSRLPALRALAPEVYDNLPSHPSWPLVMWNFIFDDTSGLFARLKRASKATAPAGSPHPQPSSTADFQSSPTPPAADSGDETVLERGYADWSSL